MTTKGNRNNQEARPQVHGVTPNIACDLLRQGHTVLDARSPDQYGQGHVEGAVNVNFQGHHFAERAAKVTPRDARLILVVQEPADAQQAAEELSRAGRPNITGYLTGGTRDWQVAGLPVVRTPQITVRELETRGEREDGRLQVLDVREQNEWTVGHIPGAIHIPFHELDQRIGELNPSNPVAAYCSTGQRSSTATSILERHDFHTVSNVEGGFSAWRQAAYPVQREEAPVAGATGVEDLGYALQTRIDIPFQEALARVHEAVRAEGMELITETDLQKLLQQKLGIDIGRYRILGVCDLQIASEGVQTVPEIGIFMPCNVLIYEQGGRSVITAVNSDAIVSAVQQPALGDCASGIRTKMEMILHRVRQAGLPKAA